MRTRVPMSVRIITAVFAPVAVGDKLFFTNDPARPS
jgi:hypothetical protein